MAKKKAKKKTIPVRRGFGYAKVSFNMDKCITRLKRMSRRLLKFCHKQGCEDFMDCPETCSCGGIALDLNTAFVWSAGKNLDGLAGQFYGPCWWLNEWKDVISSKTDLETAVYDAYKTTSEAGYCIDEFEKIYRYLVNSGTVLGLHRTKYQKEHTLIRKAKHALYDTLLDLWRIRAVMKKAVRDLERLERDERRKKDGDK